MCSPAADPHHTLRERLAPVLRAMKRGRAAHAYLLLGPPAGGCAAAGCLLIRAFLCPDRPDEGCGRCRSCLGIGRDAHPDYAAVRPASRSRQVLIEQVRDLETRLSRKPVWGQRRAGLIQEADRMTIQAANAFLKTLEEPPPETLLVLTAAALEGLPETIVSRCQRVYIGEIEPAPRPEWLPELEQAIAALDERAEGQQQQQGRLASIYAPLGAILGILSRLLDECREEPEIPEDADRVLSERMKREGEARSQSRYVARRRAVVEAMAAWYRDALAASLGVMVADEGVVDAGSVAGVARKAEEGRPRGGGLTPDIAENRLASVHELQRDLDRNVQEALAFETCLLKLVSHGT